MGIRYPKEYAIMMGEDGGAFKVPFESRELTIIASHGGGWYHVSVSLPNRCPNWREMSFIKELFFEPEDCVIQYHPPESMKVNDCSTCLHLWMPQHQAIPMPPLHFV